MTLPRSWAERAALVGLAVGAGVAWSSPLGAPLRLLVVLFHELGHAGAAVLTGGEVLEIAVRLDASGHALTRGGAEVWVLNAGYLGAQAIGFALVELGRAHPRTGAALLCACFVAGAYWAGWSLAGAVCVLAVVVTVMAIVAASRREAASGSDPARTLRWAVQALGVLAIVHAVLDAASDHGAGDAALLAARTWVPAIVWSALWVTTGTALAVVWARTALRGVRSSGRPSGP